MTSNLLPLIDELLAAISGGECSHEFVHIRVGRIRISAAQAIEATARGEVRISQLELDLHEKNIQLRKANEMIQKCKEKREPNSP